MKIKKICLYCGKEFECKTSDDRKYCSVQCMRLCPIYKENLKSGVHKYVKRIKELPDTDVTKQKFMDSIKNAQKVKTEKSKTRNYVLYGNSKIKPIKLDVSVEYVEKYRQEHPVCEICGKPEKVKTNGRTVSKLAVDHNHKTGKFRGLLCCDCNRKLGWFENLQDNILNYLNKKPL